MKVTQKPPGLGDDVLKGRDGKRALASGPECFGVGEALIEHPYPSTGSGREANRSRMIGDRRRGRRFRRSWRGGSLTGRTALPNRLIKFGAVQRGPADNRGIGRL